jgi:hypothetical protein
MRQREKLDQYINIHSCSESKVSGGGGGSGRGHSAVPSNGKRLHVNVRVRVGVWHVTLSNQRTMWLWRSPGGNEVKPGSQVFSKVWPQHLPSTWLKLFVISLSHCKQISGKIPYAITASFQILPNSSLVYHLSIQRCKLSHTKSTTKYSIK